MAFKIFALCKPSEICEIKGELNRFLVAHSKNPFIFAESIIDEMDSALANGALSVVLVFRHEGKIVGVSPLVIRTIFGIRFARQLFGYDYSPDLFFEPVHADICIEQVVRFVFGPLGCRFFTLDLPWDSPNLPVVRSACQINNVTYRVKNDAKMQHCVLPVNSTWDEYLKSKSSNFRHRFKNIERKLRAAGEWRISCYENCAEEQAVFDKIMSIEKTCWKQSWREERELCVDEYLLKDWKWSGSATKNLQNFTRHVWFLELNDHVIGYSLVVQYYGVAYVVKTSFDNQFRHLYPGIYLLNGVIRELFCCGTVRLIDFMTDLPFMEIWTKKRLGRVRFLLSKGFVPKLYCTTIELSMVRNVLKKKLPPELI